jgi:hypothetical protein
MAKRTSLAEEPYNPLDPLLAQSVITGGSVVQEGQRPSEVKGGRGNGTEPLGQHSPALNARIVAMPGPARLENPEHDGTERRCREKRVMLSRSEERQIERLVDRMADELKTSLKLSHVLRAAVSVLLHAEEELVRRLQSIEPLERPSNWDQVGLAQFEHGLAKLVSQALREAPPLR